MVTNTGAGSVDATVAWMDAKGQSAPGVAGLSLDTARLLVVDAPIGVGGAVRSDRSAGELGGRLVGWWPWEPKVVDHVLRGGSLDHRSIRRFDARPVGRSTIGDSSTT